MSLQQQINDDLKTAMKARDRERMSALRLLVAAVRNAAVAAGRSPRGVLSDDEIVKLVQSETKRRREAADAFRTGDREQAAANEDFEAEVYSAYLPAQLGDEELAGLVDQAIADTGATDRSGMGPVIRQVMGAVAGRADGSRVSAMVGQRLA